MLFEENTKASTSIGGEKRNTNQPAGPLVDPLGKIVNIEQIWKNGIMK